MTESERRIRRLEMQIEEMGRRLADVRALAGKAQQDTQIARSSAGGGGNPGGGLGRAAVTTGGGITAGGSGVLGAGNILLHNNTGSTLTSGDTVICYNNFEVEITHPSRLVVIPFGGGTYLLVGAEGCTIPE